MTPPVASPDCQYRCRNRNATTSGMMETSEPVITIENRAWEPEPAAEVACHCARPTVSGKYRAVEHDQGQEVVVPRRDQGEQQHRDEPRCEQSQHDTEEDAGLAGPVDARRLEQGVRTAPAA